MLPTSTLSFFLLAATLLPSFSLANQKSHDLIVRKNARDLKTCKDISAGISKSSQVYYEGSPEYSNLTAHYMTSSSQNSTCVFLPTTPEDLSIAIKIIGQQESPFAISSGSHTSNPGQSSTKGVHISMKGFQHVNLSPDKSWVDLGSGNVWDKVYQSLQNTGRIVVGSRAPGIGVGGMITGGGGYSFLTDQYGLTVDTLIGADMVLPDGTLKSVTAKDSDLFFAIRGGGNRFGIIYNFRLKTFPGNQVWGGSRLYTQDQFESVLKGIETFTKSNKDPKANILPSFGYAQGASFLSLTAFYDGPSPPAGTFSAFDQAKALQDDWKAKSYVEIIQDVSSDVTKGQRGSFNTVSLEKYSPSLLAQIINQTQIYGAQGAARSATLVTIAAEPFLNYGKLSKGGAFDHSNSPSPLHFYFAWIDSAQDDYFKASIKSAVAAISQQAKAEGQNIDALNLYPNYALSNTSPKKLFGEQNADRLERIRKQYDPKGVMLRAGYFKFTY